MQLKPDAQAEYILQHLEEYYAGQSALPAPEPEDSHAWQEASHRAAARQREGARQVIQEALYELTLPHQHLNHD